MSDEQFLPGSIRQKIEQFLNDNKESSTFDKEQLSRLFEDITGYSNQTELHKEELLSTIQNQKELLLKIYSLLDESSYGYVILDQDFTIQITNQAFNSVTGCAPIELINSSVLRFIWQDDLAKFKRNCRQVIKSGQKKKIEIRFDGQDYPRLFTLIIEPVKQDKSILVRFVNTNGFQNSHEITKSRVNNTEFDYLMAVVRDGMVLLDSECHILTASTSFCDMTGYSLKELQQIDNFFELSSEATRSWEQNEVWVKLMKDGFSEIYEKEFMCRNGEKITTEFSLYSDPTEKSRSDRFWGIARDISDRLRAGQTLLAQDERYDVVALFTNEWEYWRGTDGSIKYVSPSCERISGYSPSDFEKNPNLLEQIIHPEDKEEFRHHKVLTGIHHEGDEVHFMNFRIICKDKSVKWIGHSCQNIRTSDGTYLGIRGSNRDITEKKRIEASLDEKNRSLAFLNRMAIDLASLHEDQNLPVFLAKQLKEFTDGIFVSFSEYDPTNKTLVTKHIEIENELLKKVLKFLNQDHFWFVSPVSDESYEMIIKNSVGLRYSITEITLGGIPPVIGRPLKALLNADRFYALVYVIEGELIGTSIIALSADQPDPPADFLVSFANLAAVSLRRSKTEQSLKESEERVRTTLYSIGDAVISTDQFGRIRKMNPVAEKMTGWAEHDARGKDLSEIFHIVNEDTRSIVQNPVMRILQQGMIIGLANHTLLISKDGREIPIADSGAPIRDPNGNILGVILVFRDQTTEREIQYALVKEKQTAKQYFNTAGVIMIVLDDTGNVREINKKGCEILGYKEEEITGKNWFRNFLPAHNIDLIYSKYLEIISGDLSPNEYVENSVLCKDGEEKLIAWHNSVIRNDQGKVIGTLSSGEDITLRKQVEQALRDSEEKYRSLIENMLDAVLILDFSGNILFYNPPALNLYGNEVAFDPIGVNITMFLHPDSVNQAFLDIEKVKSGEKTSTKYRIIRANGDIGWIQSLSTRINYRGAEVSLVILHDITDQKLNEESLRLSEEKFAKAFNSNPAAVILSRLADGIIIDANESYQKMFGFSHEELIGQTGLGLGIFENPDLRNDILNKLKTIGAVRNLETKLRHKHGTRLDVLLSVEKIEINRENCLLSTIQDISDRKKAEEKIVQSSNRLNVILNAMPDIMFIIDRNGDFVEYYSRSTDVLALPPDTIIGNNISSLFPQAEVSRYLKAFDQVLENKTLGTLEYQLPIDGVEMYFEARITPFDMDQVLCIVRNITEQKRLEKEIAYYSGMRNLVTRLGSKFINLSSKKFDTAIAESMAEIGEFTHVDRVYLFDYDFEKGIIINTYEWCAAGIKPEIDNLQEVPMSATPGWVETHQKGDNICIQSVSSLDSADNLRQILEAQEIKSLITLPMIYEGKCLGFVGFDSVKAERYWSEDEVSILKLFAELLTNLKIKFQVEAKLLEVESINKFITSNITDAVCLVDTDGKYTYVTPSHETVTGRGMEVIGENFLKYIHAEDYKKILQIIVTGSESGLTKNVEYRYLHPKGYIWLESTGKRHYDASGKLFGLITSRNITDRMKNQEELISAKERAEESDRLKTAFLNNMSHEIRTPLNVIMGFTELLRDPLKSQNEYHYFSRIITQSSNHLLSIINDIMSIATIEAGQEKVRETHTDINRLLERLYQEFIIRLETQEVVFYLTSRLHDDSTKVLTDETKIVQVMSNLISNAIKFTHKGKIEYGCIREDDHLKFFVEDTGIGIPQAYHDRIFERFRQVDDKTTRKYGGNGLGLSISKAYVEILGGKIWVESEVGKGSKFIFTVPYKPSGPIAESELKPEVTETLRKARGTKTILVAEDEASNYLLLEKLLADNQFRLIHVVNGKQALEVCQNDPSIDLVIMDLKMPVMDGLTATGLIKKDKPDLPVIALTAYALSGDKERALRAGCNEYISKPFTKADLLAVLDRLLVKQST
jgi:PAS domain S-box-containing protein